MTKVDLVAAAIKSCFVRKKAESSRSGKHGLLNSLPIPERYWTDMSIGFAPVTSPLTVWQELPTRNGGCRQIIEDEVYGLGFLRRGISRPSLYCRGTTNFQVSGPPWR